MNNLKKLNMQSPYKRIVVYDLETGGFSCKHNSITEIAMVAIDLETLDIIEETSIMFRPQLDLSSRLEEPLKQAQDFFKLLKIKDEDSKVNILHYKNHQITLKSLEPLIEDIELFYEFLEGHGDIVTWEDLQELYKDEKLKPIAKLFFDWCYNPQALEVTHISEEMLVEEGIEPKEAFAKVKGFISSHTVGNSKPIMSGHNIGSLPRRIVKGKEKGPDGFDNPFMEKLFKDNGDDYFDSINELIYDTLKMARIRWSEMPSYSLGVCANEVGLTLKEAHRALPDTVANAKFLIKMLKNLRGEGGQASKYKRRKFKFNF